MVNQKQIAEALNMTQQAVSAALRPEGMPGTVRVAPKTRQLVLETAKKMGYRSNRYASILKSGKSQLIAILYISVSYDWVDKVQAISQEIKKQGYIPWPYDIRSYRDRLEELMDLLLMSKVEGIVVTTGTPVKLMEMLFTTRIPMVALQSIIFEGIPWVGPDKVAGFVEITRHLYEQGCKRVFIGRPEPKSKFDRRPHPEMLTDSHAGFLEYYRQNRLPKPELPLVFLPENYTEEPHTLNGNIDEYKSGYLLAQESLKHCPDALILPNDNTAMGALCGFRDAGLRVPEDICVTGFNGELQTLYSWIPITTVYQPATSMGQEIGKLIAKLIQTPHTNRYRKPSYHSCRFEARQSSTRIPLTTHTC